MKMKKGFTLIELLVVVLIIGILSSVALPQYTKAVHRARATEAWTIGKSVRTAQDVFFMANNEYASDMEDLDIQIPEISIGILKNFLSEAHIGAWSFRERELLIILI
ncbi:MAG: prepilin-type N-terminal cleavage/methylation domain-containing protein [Elusimicrobiaceae bacterium]|nr:prepilin-type N-terminal cleavage/methylation domain-containing protein [Elusimicrobiaceae bacterium]